MKKATLLAVLVACAGCTQVNVSDRLRPIIREKIARVEAAEDQKLDDWRDLRALVNKLGCAVSVGARQRASSEERAELDALEC